MLQRQKGFQHEISFVAAERNEALVISFWDSQDDADAYNHEGYLDVLRLLSKVVGGMPIAETFEVASSTSRDFAAGAGDIASLESARGQGKFV